MCAAHKLLWTPPARGSIVGIARDVGAANWPLNGLRHPAEGSTSGWYLWAGEGELNQDLDYFQPVHVEHLHERCPQALPYLGLPPGSIADHRAHLTDAAEVHRRGRRQALDPGPGSSSGRIADQH